ncbi:MAG: hypothetical protein OEM81_13230 [Acidimicrobiia bacterium]|nr:hypothetical protein [Acidimicrobiia bacterium]
MHKLMLLVLVVVLLGLAAVPVTAGSDRPFKAKADLVSSIGPVPNPQCGDPAAGFLGVEEVWEGTGTHLGRFHEFSTLCLDVRDFNPPTQPLTPFKVYGKSVAANGDELTFFAEGIFNVLTCEITGGGFEFTGGTGRFQSVEGSGTTAFVRDSQCNASALRHTGVISY